uniref:Uncharacterized protein n=1 Tax=Noctiluca scintillans TaxID=2966 RepID=A0A7S1F3X0_NOCSC
MLDSKPLVSRRFNKSNEHTCETRIPREAPTFTSARTCVRHALRNTSIEESHTSVDRGPCGRLSLWLFFVRSGDVVLWHTRECWDIASNGSSHRHGWTSMDVAVARKFR